MTFLNRLVVFPAIMSMMMAISAPAAPDVAKGERVKQVEAKYACFINKKRFDKPQTAVVVDGKAYYGCCATCAQTLKEDAKSRMDIDPVSGKEVDKATAVVGADKAGNIYFFENVENLKTFRVPAK